MDGHLIGDAGVITAGRGRTVGRVVVDEIVWSDGVVGVLDADPEC